MQRGGRRQSGRKTRRVAAAAEERRARGRSADVGGESRLHAALILHGVSIHADGETPFEAARLALVAASDVDDASRAFFARVL